MVFRMCRQFLALIMVAGICFLTLSGPAHAGKKVYSPIIEGKGELEFETLGRYNFDDRKEKNGAQKYENAVGYTVTDRWATELYGKFKRDFEEDANGNSKLSRLKFTDLEWSNRYQLTEKGQFWLDIGLYTAYEIPLRNKHPGEIEGKILLAKSTSHFTHMANVIFKQEVGGGRSHDAEGAFAWSSKYRLCQRFQPGFEYWADFGALNQGLSYNEQSHQVGPVAYGHLTGNIKYDVGYLFGISPAAPDGELKWILEYEMKF